MTLAYRVEDEAYLVPLINELTRGERLLLAIVVEYARAPSAATLAARTGYDYYTMTAMLSNLYRKLNLGFPRESDRVAWAAMRHHDIRAAMKLDGIMPPRASRARGRTRQEREERKRHLRR
jgi:hypothetical protein